MLTLYLIPARGGSKGLPGKNIRLLGGKPLLTYSIDLARELTTDEHICVTTDSAEIAAVAEQNRLAVPFVRPATLAADNSGSREVIIHALDFYKEKRVMYDVVVLLQPTSPFRSARHVREMLEQYTPSIDMVVSVKQPHVNPYFSLFEENDGFLRVSKPGNFKRRQDCPAVYAYNGSVYVINVKSLYAKNFSEFEKVKKFEMDEIHSVDIDNAFDWLVAETIIEKSLWVNG